MRNPNEERGAVQLISTTPEEMANLIADSVRKEVAAFFSELETKEKDEWLTRHEVAEIFKVNLSTIHRWSEKGILKRYGIGNKVYYKKSEVEASVEPLIN